MPICLALVFLAGCQADGPSAATLAARHGFSRRIVPGEGFRHLVFASPGTMGAGAVLDLYLEGDGLPWASPDRVSPDPTPRHALALELMARDPGPSAYLGRPCYFEMVHDPGCSAALWTDARYGPAVLDSMASAIGRLRRQLGAGRIRLIGYSGGGALAVLLAPRLPDLAGVVTIGADLDLAAWTRHADFSPLAGSLDPAREPALPAGLPQLYFYGGRDAVVPAATAARYLARVPPGSAFIWPDFDHACCWADAWGKIVAAIRAGRPPGCTHLGCRPLAAGAS